MNLFVAMMIIGVWCVFSNNSPQTPSALGGLSLLEKRAVVDTQRILTSELDAELPRLPFATWIRQVVGPGVEVSWQLSECGEQSDAPSNSTVDIRACTEVNAILADDRKVVIMIAVGTFRKGRTTAPAFYYGVIEQQAELYPVRRLRDLPGLLRTPGRLVKRSGVRLPAAAILEARPVVNNEYVARLPEWNGNGRGQLVEIGAAPPPPSPSAKPQPSMATSRAENQGALEEPGLTVVSGAPKPSGAVLWGEAITKVQPRYPANAKRVNASGPVDVQITISQVGRVIEARAVSGHLLLRDAAVEASRQWIFKPAILNGIPVETQIVLTFVFKVPNK